MKIVPRRACTHFVFTVLGFTILTNGSASAADEAEKTAESAAKKYTATAFLLVERREPHILPRSAEKDDPAEFEGYRATQMQLFKSPYVLIAALRDPKVQKQPSIKREEARHHAVAWLGKEICVKCPDEKTGILTVSLTSNDPNEAAMLVNAVVNAYVNEVVDVDRQQRRDRLADLQKIRTEKEEEVRVKRQQLKQELENIGAGDEQTMPARTQLAMSMYAEFQHEFQRMRAEHRMLLGQLQVAKRTMEELPKAEIAEVEVAAILNNNSMYRDLQSRLEVLESNRRNDVATNRALPQDHEAPTEPNSPPMLPEGYKPPAESNPPKSRAAVPVKKPTAKSARIMAELEATRARIEYLEEQTREQIRDALRIELKNNIHRFETQLEISTEQLATFEKQVERKREEAESVGRGSIAAQMARAEVEDIERILRAVSMERETQRVELNASPRVRVLGDRNAPAAVPECPD